MTRQLIVQAIEKGATTPHEVFAFLETSHPGRFTRPRVAQTLARLRDGGILQRVEYGTYGLDPRYKSRLESAASKDVSSILEALRAAGGFERRWGIDAAIWDRDRKSDARPYEYVCITKALTNNPSLFHRWPGGWRLGVEELKRLPLRGALFALNHEHEAGLGEAFGEFAGLSPEDFFCEVGSAFAEARNGADLSAVAESPDVASCLAAMVPKCRDALEGIDDDWVDVDDIEEGFLSHQRRLALEAYALFEDGDVDAHKAAPMGFYIACAGVLGVCPVKLSRGAIMNPLESPALAA